MTLSERRQGLGWTQEHLSQTSGISVRTIQRLENGATAGGDSLQALASAPGCEVSDLLGNTFTPEQTEYAKQLLGFRAHVIAVAIIVPFLIVLNWLATPGAGWILFALGAWGVGFAARAALVFWVYRPS
jgi:transcriptional regulator with XRE-family HTH domain